VTSETPNAANEVADQGEETPPGKGVSPLPVAAGERSSVPFQFSGSGSEYFRIWIVNVVLSIVTLGIYSAWAKVRKKQYFYGSTRIQEAGFEYLADPTKILKGRLIVVSLFILYSVLSGLAPIIGTILSLAFVAGLPWLVVRSLAFNAHNSAVRNIRFGFQGKVSEAKKLYVLWPLAATLTLGLLFPYVYFRQKKFVVENTCYGTTRFTFSATPGDYYGVFLSALIPMIIGVAVVVGSAFLAPPLAVLTAVVLYLYLFAFYSVKSTNLLFNAMALASHRLESDLKIKDYMILVLTNTLAMVLTLGLFHPWAKVRTTRYKLNHLFLSVSGDLETFVADEQRQVSALGDEMSDFMDFDFGI